MGVTRWGQGDGEPGIAVSGEGGEVMMRYVPYSCKRMVTFVSAKTIIQ